MPSSHPGSPLAEAIAAVAQSFPASELRHLARLVTSIPDPSGSGVATKLHQSQGNPKRQEAVAAMLAAWRQHEPPLHGAGVALALEAAARVGAGLDGQGRAELAWTGPATNWVPLRRTEQVLLEMIRNSSEEIWLLSFAVHSLEAILTELTVAHARGVQVNLLFESAVESEGKLKSDDLAHLKNRLPRDVALLIWPLEKREVDEAGKRGSLHAKGIVVDGRDLFITSANLTRYAMQLNMELGVQILNTPLADRLRRHLRELERSHTISPSP